MYSCMTIKSYFFAVVFFVISASCMDNAKSTSEVYKDFYGKWYGANGVVIKVYSDGTGALEFVKKSDNGTLIRNTCKVSVSISYYKLVFETDEGMKIKMKIDRWPSDPRINTFSRMGTPTGTMVLDGMTFTKE
jgi:hypothetical protein